MSDGEPLTAQEWIDAFGAATRDEQLATVNRLLVAAEMGNACFEQDHNGLMVELNHTRDSLARAYKATNGAKQSLIQVLMVHGPTKITAPVEAEAKTWRLIPIRHGCDGGKASMIRLSENPDAANG